MEFKMPYTKIFSGMSGSSTSFGYIEISGKGDTGIITFKDHERNETKAKIQAYTLSELKKTKDFKNAQEDSGVESLLHEWKTKRVGSKIVKYSGNDELAFVFSSDGDVNSDFEKLASSGEAFLVDYFKELHAVKSLKDETGLTLDQLRLIPGMDEKRVTLLINNISGMIKLLAHGVTIEQLGKADFAQLTKHLHAAWKIKEALKFVTIQQILGINHVPPAMIDLPKKSNDGYIYCGGSGGGTWGDFSYTHNDKSIDVTYDKNKATLQVMFGTLKDEYVPSEAGLSKMNPDVMLHRWYTLENEVNDKKEMVTTRYCPELKMIHRETTSPEFPEKEFKNGHYFSMLLTSPFYDEVAFGNFLNKKGTSIATLKSIPGMTTDKLALMFKDKYTIEDMLSKGMTFTDFANVDEKRFKYVLTNFSEAKSALEFVEPRELFGLANRPRRHSGLFDGSAASASVASSPSNDNNNEERSGCRIM